MLIISSYNELDIEKKCQNRPGLIYHWVRKINRESYRTGDLPILAVNGMSIFVPNDNDAFSDTNDDGQCHLTDILGSYGRTVFHEKMF